MFIRTLNAATRTVAVRLEMANPQGLLKPGMFAQVEMPVSGRGEVLTVPNSAVIDSGTRQIVLVAAGARALRAARSQFGRPQRQLCGSAERRY